MVTAHIGRPAKSERAVLPEVVGVSVMRTKCEQDENKIKQIFVGYIKYLQM